MAEGVQSIRPSTALYGGEAKAQALRGPERVPIFAPTMGYLHQLIFASEAELVAMTGAGLVLFSLLALFADRKRLKRKQLDRVGWMPWTGLFLLAFVSGAGLIGLALPRLAAGN